MTAQRDYVNKLYGPDRMAPFLEDIAKERKSIEGNKDRNLGYALLAAAQGIVSDSNMARATGKAMGAFGSEMQKLEKEDREAKRALRQSEMTLAAAQQARDDGKTKEAISLFDKYDTQKQNAQN
jgi:Sec-independent protein translocase protein TatA